MSVCGQYVSDGRMSYTCRREAVEDGMCKPHAAGARRRKANDAKRAEEARARDAVLTAIQTKCEALAALGVDALPQIGALTYEPTGRVHVDPDVLLALLQPAAGGVVHLMDDDGLDACDSAPHGEPLTTTPVLGDVTCAECRMLTVEPCITQPGAPE